MSCKRRELNGPVSYSDGRGLESVEIVSIPDPEGENPLLRMEMEMGVQAVEDTSEVACQTERFVYSSTPFLHLSHTHTHTHTHTLPDVYHAML